MSSTNQPTTYVATPRLPRPWRADRVVRGRARQLRREATPAERTLWTILRNAQLDGYRFRRQHPVGDFIVDFLCPAALLVIEVDGDTHEGRGDYDRRRTRHQISCAARVCGGGGGPEYAQAPHSGRGRM